MSTPKCKHLIELEEARVGPAFPAILDHDIIPPRFRTIVRNRVIPQYHLGWSLSHEEFMEKYNPSEEFDCNVNTVYDRKLWPEWRKGLPEKWQRLAPDVSVMEPGDDDKADTPTLRYVLAIATNTSKASLARAEDRVFTKLAQQLVQMTDEPKWYKL